MEIYNVNILTEMLNVFISATYKFACFSSLDVKFSLKNLKPEKGKRATPTWLLSVDIAGVDRSR